MTKICKHCGGAQFYTRREKHKKIGIVCAKCQNFEPEKEEKPFPNGKEEKPFPESKEEKKEVK